MNTLEDLQRTLRSIDGRGYKAYKDLEGQYKFDRFTLLVDHVQGDPFASPSKVLVRVDHKETKLPASLWNTKVRSVALRDFLTRCVSRSMKKVVQGHRGIGRSGLWSIDVGGQEVLERTSVVVTDQWVEGRLEVGLPATGRTILGKQAEAMLVDELPRIVEGGLVWSNLSESEGHGFVNQVENYHAIRRQLDERGLVAFVADGSVLPRVSGASDLPLPGDGVIGFRTPESLKVTVELPNSIQGEDENRYTISGMGIPKGLTLIVGGGYHGKSTLLQALQRGVYPHILGDGREYVVTVPDAVKIRAEDGRKIERVNISGFISHLPQGQATDTFTTEKASGSTSQAATILEGLEVGAPLMLMDEDTSATNFMVRDARMQALVEKENEPITPFLDRVRELAEISGVSTVLVMGGCGDYFDVADTVIMMRNYLPIDVTNEAKRVAEGFATERRTEVSSPMPTIFPRIPLAESIDPSRGRKEVKIQVRSRDEIGFGYETIDLRGVEQLVDISQTRAVGYALNLAAQRFVDGKTPLREIVEAVMALLDREGLDVLDPFHRLGRHPGNFARPRGYEVAAAINRLRTVRMRGEC